MKWQAIQLVINQSNIHRSSSEYLPNETLLATLQLYSLVCEILSLLKSLYFLFFKSLFCWHQTLWQVLSLMENFYSWTWLSSSNAAHQSNVDHVPFWRLMPLFKKTLYLKEFAIFQLGGLDLFMTVELGWHKRFLEQHAYFSENQNFLAEAFLVAPTWNISPLYFSIFPGVVNQFNQLLWELRLGIWSYLFQIFCFLLLAWIFLLAPSRTTTLHLPQT